MSGDNRVLSGVRHWFSGQRWWLLRLVIFPVQLAAFALITFVVIRMIPGDPVETVTGGQYTQEVYDAVQRSLGLDGSFLDQLWRYVRQLAWLDLGNSLITGRPIAPDLWQKLPATVELAIMALSITVLLAVLGSHLVVLHPRFKISGLLRGYARTAASLPEFVLGIAAILVFYATLRWAPPPMGRLSQFIDPPPAVTNLPLLDALLSGDTSIIMSMLSHLVLPVGVMVFAQTPVLIKILLGDLEAAVSAPMTRFRIASGASRGTVLRSVYRRALPASVTMVGTMFGYLLGGALVVETMFGLDGIGRYSIDAVMSVDLPTMQSVMLVVAALTLLVFMLVDLINMLLDPRRRPGAREES
jgi:ABC-type dipeptide/oligopeptide/nickel transport system permease component